MMTWLFGDQFYWRSIEMTYLNVDVMMFIPLRCFEKIFIYACLVIY